MPKKTKPDTLEHFVKTPPKLTILSDEAIIPGANPEVDTFDLGSKLGPIYDILRHPETITPFTIAIYGSWGSGKTTAMQTLRSLLNRWSNRTERQESDATFRTIWFDPWKYDAKEEVWRGLLAEVILSAVAATQPTLPIVRKAINDFGMFLGNAFIHLLAGLKLKAGTSGSGAELSLAGLQEIARDARAFASPQKAYLNEFEATLRSWVLESLGPHDRLVVFIDDLDRCMPDVALQVLEALKLYLNIPRLAFVVGLDRQIIEELIEGHYRRLDVKPDRGRQYLAKIFQVELELAPTDEEIGRFYGRQLNRVELWRELPSPEREAAQRIILKLAGRNPREIKRTINSALMYADTARRSTPDRKETDAFRAGIQIYFIRRILADRYKRASFLDQDFGRRFFHRWSRLSSRHGPRLLHMVPPDAPTPAAVEASFSHNASYLASLPSVWGDFGKDVLREPRAADLVLILRDPDIADLMRFQISEGARNKPLTPRLELLTAEVVKEGAARTLAKQLDELNPVDLQELRELDLRGMEITDLGFLAELPHLRVLDLSETRVVDLEPLRHLVQLTSLDLSATAPVSLGPLALLPALTTLHLRKARIATPADLSLLSGLRELSLASSNLTDLTPLRSLKSLETLLLQGLDVADLAPLSELHRLVYLDLAGSNSGSIEALRGLRDLKVLDINQLAIRDFKVLTSLVGLEVLSLSGTTITDLEPITKLLRLRELDLSGTSPANLEVLLVLPNLRELDLRRSSVSAESVEELTRNMPQLAIFTGS